MFMDGKAQHGEGANSPQGALQINTFAVRVSAGFWLRIDKLFLKLYRNAKEPKKPKNRGKEE